MSIKLMSAIFDAEFHDLEYEKDGEKRKAKASTAKLLLLAIADHANDYGESSYPGYDKLEIKTALSRQGISDTLEALKFNGLLDISPEPSRLGTNNYTINIRSLPAIARELPDIIPTSDLHESSGLTHVSQVARLGGVKPLDHNHPLTIIKPSREQQKGDLVDGLLELSQSSGMKKLHVKEYIASQIKVRLALNPSGKDAESFIDYAAQCQAKSGWAIDTFLDWWLVDANGGKRAFWSFKRMEQFYDGAFAQPPLLDVPAEPPADPGPAPVYTPHPRLKEKNRKTFEALEALG